MQAQLIYNGNAGNNGSADDTDTTEALLEALKESGFDPVHDLTECEEDLDEVLNKVEGLVVVAGGDGTVRAVATRLAGSDRPMTILPMGTANNIAKTLDLPQDPFKIITGLAEPRKTVFDIGHVEAPWGEDYFLEGAGFGFFADVLATYDPEEGKSILRGLGSLGEKLIKGHVYDNTLSFNGRELSGEFLLVEVLNTQAVGPRLKFDSAASPQDGLLNLVTIRPSDREGFLRYVTSLAQEKMEELESVTIECIEDLRFAWQGFPLHVDGIVRPPDWKDRQEREEDSEFGPRVYIPLEEQGEIRIKIIPEAVNLWLPSPVDESNE